MEIEKSSKGGWEQVEINKAKLKKVDAKEDVCSIYWSHCLCFLMYLLCVMFLAYVCLNVSRKKRCLRFWNGQMFVKNSSKFISRHNRYHRLFLWGSYTFLKKHGLCEIDILYSFFVCFFSF